MQKFGNEIYPFWESFSVMFKIFRLATFVARCLDFLLTKLILFCVFPFQAKYL